MMKWNAVHLIQLQAEDPFVARLCTSHEEARNLLTRLLKNCEEIRNNLLVFKQSTTAVDTMRDEIMKELG